MSLVVYRIIPGLFEGSRRVKLSKICRWEAVLTPNSAVPIVCLLKTTINIGIYFHFSYESDYAYSMAKANVYYGVLKP